MRRRGRREFLRRWRWQHLFQQFVVVLEQFLVQQ
ncbi:hypothetical protein ABAC460_11435 [Asticcacaulis sp. AC460]|nr:hypothetical protein ABAC460_11435 [Asticcacaulis sp. AC460]